MPISSMPQWKVALLERRKNDKIPTWKKELLKRIHAKDETVRQSFIFGVHENEDGSILNEHILKVSDNVFVRMELQRKMRSSYSLRNEKSALPSPRRHHSEVIPEELPGEGMVDRLTGRFGTERRYNTSVVTSSTLAEDRLGLNKSRSESTSDAKDFLEENTFSSPRNQLATLSHQESAPIQDFRNRSQILLRSIDVMTPKGFTRSVPKPIIIKSAPGLTSPPLIKKSTPGVTSPPLIKKFSAPVLNNTKPPLPPKSDLVLKLPPNNSHNLKSKTRTTNSEADLVMSSTPPASASDRTVVTSSAPSKTPTTRTSSNDVVDKDGFTPRESKPIPKKRSTRTPSTTPTDQSKDFVSIVLPALALARSSLPNKNYEKINGCHVVKITDDETNTTKIGAGVIIPPPDEYKEDFVESEVGRSSDVVNTRHTEITDMVEPKPRKINSDIKVTEAKIYSPTQQNGGCSQIIELGRTSLDSSLLVSQHAIALNEVVKNSRSFQIVPSNARKQALSSDVVLEEKSALEITSVSSKNNIPVSCDNTTSTTSHQQSNSGFDCQTANTVVIEPTVVTVTGSKPLESAYLSANDVKADKVKQKGATEPAKRQESATFARPRLSGPGVVSTTSFGGKSFMIDPSKFKKSATSSTDNGSKVSFGTTDNPGSQRKVDNPVSNGKRKLRADQIIVIGGYVKLRRSSLAKPNKVCKEIRVKFDESLLESVYHYPSEESLLSEGAITVTNSLHTHPLPSRRDSQLDKFTTKSLLARHEVITSDDEDDD